VVFLNLGDSYANDTKWGGASGGKNSASARGNYQGQRLRRATGFRPKSKMLLPHRVAIALQDEGWIVRQDFPWLKPNATPESVRDRPVTAHEYIFMLAKNPTSLWQMVKRPSTGQTGRAAGFVRSGKAWRAEVVPGQGYAQHRARRKETKPSSERNYRTTDAWGDSLDDLIAQTEARLAHLKAVQDKKGGLMLAEDGEPLAMKVSTRRYDGDHFAAFPPRLVMDLLRGIAPRDDGDPPLALDPFCGTGTVGEVCRQLGLRFIGIDLSAEYLARFAASRAGGRTMPGAGLEKKDDSGQLSLSL
jgi:DNA modification methylase